MTRVEQIPPRHVAAAIAELGAEQVRDAWRYLEAWEAIASAGVPRSTIRECLAEPLLTGPCKAVLDWEAKGARGLLCLVGAPGVGKTYAAARWAVLRHARRASTAWLSIPSLSMLSLRARDARLAEVADRPALVLDDVGAGFSQGDMLRDQLRGMIQHRIDGTGPRGLGSTIVASNAGVDEIRGWLGERIVDRCKIAGGFAPIRSGESLRRPAEVQIDALGRGPEWYRAHRLVEVIGCREVERVDEGGRPRTDLDVGDRLDAAARREGYAPCRMARELLGLTKSAVEAEAERLVEVELRMARALSDRFGVEVDARRLTLEGVAAAMAEQARRQQAEARARHSAEIHAVTARARRYETVADPIDARPAPAWTEGPRGRKALRRLGFGVVEVGDGRWRTVRKVGDATQILATGSTSDREAWEIAAKLCAEVDTRPGGDAATE